MKPLFENATVASDGTSSSQLLVPSPFETANLPAVQSTPLQVSPPRLTEGEIEQLGGKDGAGLGSLSTRILSEVRAADTGEFGEGLSRLVVVAKGLDPKTLSNKGSLKRVLGFFGSAKEKLIAQYASVEKQMDSLIQALDMKAALHKQRIGDLETMYAENEAYHSNLAAAVKYGEDLLLTLQEDFKAQQAVAAQDAFGAQRLADHQRIINRLEVRLDTLQRAMLLAVQSAPQIRLMQESARALVEKFGNVKLVTLPAWRNAFSLYCLQLEQKQSVELLDQVDAVTDEALRASADLLRSNTAAIAKARSRSVVSLETLEHIQTQLLGSVEDVQRIEREAKARRQIEQPKLLEMERALVKAFAPNRA